MFHISHCWMRCTMNDGTLTTDDRLSLGTILWKSVSMVKVSSSPLYQLLIISKIKVKKNRLNMKKVTKRPLIIQFVYPFKWVFIPPFLFGKDMSKASFSWSSQLPLRPKQAECRKTIYRISNTFKEHSATGFCSLELRIEKKKTTTLHVQHWCILM